MATSESSKRRQRQRAKLTITLFFRERNGLFFFDKKDFGKFKEISKIQQAGKTKIINNSSTSEIENLIMKLLKHRIDSAKNDEEQSGLMLTVFLN
jgi:hypothetical protein